MTCPPSSIPDGMALIETDDGRWFPAFAPTEGSLWVRLVDDLTAGIIPPAVDSPANSCAGYQDRKTALSACHAWHEAAVAPVHWDILAAHTEIYPERNVWYLEEMARLTGDGPPLITSSYDVYAVTTSAREGYLTIIDVTAPTPDEAIETLYQRVAAWSCEPHEALQRAG